MNKTFWHDLPQPFFSLAPMEAVTDVVFRQVVTKAYRPDIFFSEFTNATGWVHAGEKATGGRLAKLENESPIVAQIWGAVAEDIAKMAARCHELGFDGLDINMGCPDKTAVRAGGGAGLIKNQPLAKDIISAAKSGELPVSVKTRLGYSRVDEWSDWLGFVLQQDITHLTVHLRTKKEMSKVPAHFELIDDIIKLRDQIAPQTLLSFNGDITNAKQGLELYQKHPGINGLMIGRGIFHNPFAFEKEQKEYSKNDLVDLLELHLELHDLAANEKPRKFDPLKRFFKIYIRDFDGAAEVRDKLMHSKTTDEVREILKEL